MRVVNSLPCTSRHDRSFHKIFRKNTGERQFTTKRCSKRKIVIESYKWKGIRAVETEACSDLEDKSPKVFHNIFIILCMGFVSSYQAPALRKISGNGENTALRKLSPYCQKHPRELSVHRPAVKGAFIKRRIFKWQIVFIPVRAAAYVSTIAAAVLRYRLPPSKDSGFCLNELRWLVPDGS